MLAAVVLATAVLATAELATAAMGVATQVKVAVEAQYSRLKLHVAGRLY